MKILKIIGITAAVFSTMLVILAMITPDIPEGPNPEIVALQEKIKKLENKPAPKPQIIEKTVTIDNTTYVNNIETNMADIISEWSPRVGFIVCRWNDIVASGSFTLAATNEGTMALTNRHVLDSEGYTPNECILLVGGQEYEMPWKENTYWLGDIEDYGYVSINIPSKVINVCEESRVKIGDKLVILGYPGVGSQESITATEGIVSGIETNYYVTSAKIEHGNSGGATILLKDNCYLGIPTYAEVGSAETFGRILKARFVLN